MTLKQQKRFWVRIANEILMYFRSLKKTAQDISMNEPIETDKEGNDLTLMDVISDDTNIVDEIDLRLKTKKLKGYVEQALNSREKIIIGLRFGLLGGREHTQREVAKQLKISRSYVSRIEKKALEKLNACFEQGKYPGCFIIFTLNFAKSAGGPF